MRWRWKGRQERATKCSAGHSNEDRAGQELGSLVPGKNNFGVGVGAVKQKRGRPRNAGKGDGHKDT